MSSDTQIISLWIILFGDYRLLTTEKVIEM